MPRRLILGLLGAVGATAAEPTRPNILLIVGDDNGCQLGCFGDAAARTPRLDALAAAGTRFTQAHVAQPSCSPSRAAMHTGLYPHQSGQFGLSHLGFTMTPKLPNLANGLKSIGYRTALFGKMHMAPAADFPFDVAGGGFDFGEKWRGNGHRDVKAMAAAAQRFITADAAPFFAVLNFYDPHDPYLDRVNGLPAQPRAPGSVPGFPWMKAGQSADNLAHYYTAMDRLDTGVGLVLDALDAAGRADNTVVVFLGDNGPPIGGRGKTTLYRGGTLTPLIVRWPNVAKPGQAREELVSTVDLLPTLYAAAGLPAPAGAYEGRTLQPLLNGAGDPAWRTTLVTEMNFHTPVQCLPARAICDHGWKLLRTWKADGSTSDQLFNLSDDLWENRNLAADPAAAGERERLASALAAWQERTADPLRDPATAPRWFALAADPMKPMPPHFKGSYKPKPEAGH